MDPRDIIHGFQGHANPFSDSRGMETRGGSSSMGAAGRGHIRQSTAAYTSLREQDQYMPIANVIRIMRRILPQHAKISDDAKETIQECVSEYISFVTSEANERCQREQRKTITAEDVLWAMGKLGFDDYIEPLTVFLNRYREIECERTSLRGDNPFMRRPVEFVPGMVVPPPVAILQPYATSGYYHMGAEGAAFDGGAPGYYRVEEPQGGGGGGGGGGGSSGVSSPSASTTTQATLINSYDAYAQFK